MRRREFMALLGSAVAWPLAARAQQGERLRRIGVLNTFAADDQEGHRRVAAFLQALHLRPIVQPIGLGIEHRWGSGDPASTRKNAEELVALAPDVLLTSGAAGVAPLLQATRTVPIVFVLVADPVGAGFVDSFAHPGGNATGFIANESRLCRLQLRKVRPALPVGSAKSVPKRGRPHFRPTQPLCQWCCASASANFYVSRL
jgi:putative tryptophan/tyrosine transport system substrate-binding protein